MSRMILFMLLSLSVQSGPAMSSDTRPLPELNAFLTNVRKHLRSNWVVQSQYTYTEKEIVRQVDSDGKVKKTETKIYEVYPSVDEEFTYKRLISKDGKPMSAEEMDKEEREYNKKRQEWQRRKERESADQKQRREEKEREAMRKEEEAVDEAFRLYEITMIGREWMDGIPVIGLSFEPRSNYATKTDGGKILKNVSGKIWFSEEDYEFVRIEAELADSLSFGLGFIVRLNKGTHMVFQRRKINQEAWLPVVSRFVGTGKILLLKGFRVDRETIYSDYKKFSVETDVRFLGPKNP